jgi:hypothetical protein
MSPMPSSPSAYRRSASKKPSGTLRTRLHAADSEPFSSSSVWRRSGVEPFTWTKTMRANSSARVEMDVRKGREVRRWHPLSGMPTDRPNARAVADDHARLCESASVASAAAPGVAVWRFQWTIRRELRSQYQPRPRASCPKRLQEGWRWGRLQNPVLNGSALGVHRQPSFPPSREGETVGCSSTLPFLLIEPGNSGVKQSTQPLHAIEMAVRR